MVQGATPINNKKCLYFCASSTPTVAELAAVSKLRETYGQVIVLSGTVMKDPNTHADLPVGQYGDNLYAADAIAGSSGSVPAAYTTAIANYPDGDRSTYANLPGVDPDSLKVVCNGFAHTVTGQAYAIKADYDASTGAVTLTDVTATNTVWTSGTTGVATIGASTGLVTGVAAGTTILTATYTDPDSGGTAVVATKSVTLT